MAPESVLGSCIVVCTLQLPNDKSNLANISLPNGNSMATFSKSDSQSQNLHSLHKTFIACPKLFSVLTPSPPPKTDSNHFLRTLQNQEELTSSTPSISDSILVEMILFSLKQGLLDEVFEVMTSKPGKGLNPGLATYNAIINGLCKNENYARAKEVLDEMLCNGLNPDAATYNTLLIKSCRKDNILQAEEIFNEMLHHGLALVRLLGGFMRNGHLDQAMGILEMALCQALKMWDERLEQCCVMDMVTYNTILNGLCREEMLAGEDQFFNEMVERVVFPDFYTFTTPIGLWMKKWWTREFNHIDLCSVTKSCNHASVELRRQAMSSPQRLHEDHLLELSRHLQRLNNSSHQSSNKRSQAFEVLFLCGTKASEACMDQLKNINGVKASINGPAITHVLYTDDIILSSKATRRDAIALMDCLDKCSSWLGQKVNNDKSRIYFSKHTQKEVANDDDVHEAPQNGDDVHEVGQNDDDVHEMHEGDDGPSTHDGVSVNAENPHRPSEGDDGPPTHDGVSVNAENPHRPSEGDDGPSTHEDLPVYTAPHRTTATENDPSLEEGHQAIIVAQSI
nr:pentatricopeptide repeat-containing protein [Quercus suber]